MLWICTMCLGWPELLMFSCLIMVLDGIIKSQSGTYSVTEDWLHLCKETWSTIFLFVTPCDSANCSATHNFIFKSQRERERVAIISKLSPSTLSSLALLQILFINIEWKGLVFGPSFIYVRSTSKCQDRNFSPSVATSCRWLKLPGLYDSPSHRCLS